MLRNLVKKYNSIKEREIPNVNLPSEEYLVAFEQKVFVSWTYAKRHEHSFPSTSLASNFDLIQVIALMIPFGLDSSPKTVFRIFEIISILFFQSEITWSPKIHCPQFAVLHMRK